MYVTQMVVVLMARRTSGHFTAFGERRAADDLDDRLNLRCLAQLELLSRRTRCLVRCFVEGLSPLSRPNGDPTQQTEKIIFPPISASVYLTSCESRRSRKTGHSLRRYPLMRLTSCYRAGAPGVSVHRTGYAKV